MSGGRHRAPPDAVASARAVDAPAIATRTKKPSRWRHENGELKDGPWMLRFFSAILLGGWALHALALWVITGQWFW